MTIKQILGKLSKRSVPPHKAREVWLAQGYSLADLTFDLMKLAAQDNASR